MNQFIFLISGWKNAKYRSVDYSQIVAEAIFAIFCSFPATIVNLFAIHWRCKHCDNKFEIVQFIHSKIFIFANHPNSDIFAII